MTHEDQKIGCGWHHTFGILRRPELDAQHAGFVYEMPDGALVVSKEGRHRHGMYVDKWLDHATGEAYIACSAVPRIMRRRIA